MIRGAIYYIQYYIKVTSVFIVIVKSYDTGAQTPLFVAFPDEYMQGDNDPKSSTMK